MTRMYIIKQQPQDFQVKEIFAPELSEEGEYAYFVLKKTNYSTLDALQKIANVLKMSPKNFGYSGLKDKKAITEQICSAKNASKEQLERIKLKDIETTFLGKADNPVSLGSHQGNSFKIIVRNITLIPKIKTKFTNFFGEQRLSTKNALIGKLIVQQKFKEAVQNLDDDCIKEYIKQHTTDFVGSLKQMPTKMLKLYVHAYQSSIWNKMANDDIEKDTLPIIGFGTNDTGIVQKILREENITVRDFIIKQIPEISSEGCERKVYAEAKKLRVGVLENDELNQGMKKVTIQFELAKGSYATEFVKQLFS